MEGDAVRRELNERRKQLARTSTQELVKDDRILESIDYALEQFSVSVHLELLAYDLSLFRQLDSALQLSSQQGLADAVRVRLQPALLPDGVLGSLIITNLDGPTKVHQLRAADVLQCITRVLPHLPPVQGTSSALSPLVYPLFLFAVRGGISVRSNLKIISITLESVSLHAIPDSLLGDLLKELENGDMASLRCGIISGILCRRTEGAGSDAAVLDSLMPYFDSSQPAGVLINIIRYLLPSLIKARPWVLETLLERLRSTGETDSDTFSAWISVASLGVSSGELSIDDLPQPDIESAISHADPEVRLRAFQMVIGGKRLLAPSKLDILKQCMRWNAALPGAGARSDFISACHGLLVQLKSEHQAQQRAMRKLQYKSAGANPSSTCQIATSDVPLDVFLEWLLKEFIDPGLSHARSYPVARCVLALGILEHYLEIFGEATQVQRSVFTLDRVEMLLACQASEFTEVRSHSRAILESAVIPLPGYETMTSPAVQKLLSAALSSLNHPRKVQAEAGKAALCILFKKLVSGDQQQAAEFINMLVQRVEKHLVVAETDLVKGMEEYPLHGPLAALREVLACLDLTDSSSSVSWSALFHHLFGIVNRIWVATSAVISLSSSKSDGEHGRTDHEIARAYEVLGENADEDEASSSHTGLLSGCWRATTEAGMLLATIVSLPMGLPEQSIWDRSDVDRAGFRFLEWMHEVRHRATFSKIATAFGKLIESVKAIESLRDLCTLWLEHELETITRDSLSTTRRSAALPFSVLALVSSDAALLDKAFNRLIELARVDNVASSDVTKVHAFNILQVVLLDAKQTKLFDRYFERAVLISLQAFSSPNWNVRNVGLILFSTLVHRSLTPSRGTQDWHASRMTLASRQTLAGWHAKYPKVIPHITHDLLQAQLPSAQRTGPGSDLNRHTPLFPLLIIVRSLRWSESGEELQNPLLQAIEPYLSSREWQVREVSAQAISSLLSPADGLQRAQNIGQTRLADLTSNMIHGNVLLLRELVAHVIVWQEVSPQDRQKIEDALVMMLRRADPNTVPPLIVKTTFDCVVAYRQEAPAYSTEIVDLAAKIARSVLRRPRPAPGYDLLLESASKLLASLGGRSGLDLLSSSSEDICAIGLEHLVLSPNPQSPATLRNVLRLAISADRGQVIQIAALEAVINARWATTRHEDELQDVKVALQSLINTIRDTKCVPLKEAALPVVAWAISVCDGNTDPAVLDSLGDQILRYSDEKESQPARLSSLQALEQLSTLLLSPKTAGSGLAGLKLQQALLRLLQDDDEGIRHGSAEIVRTGLGVARPIVQAKAVELWWTWVGDVHPVLAPHVRALWFDWFWDLAVDKAGFEDNLATLSRPAQHPTEVLFEVEPPNLFRDVLVDASFAASLLAKYGHFQMSSEKRAIIQTLHRQAEVAGPGRDPSPIEDAFEARRVVAERLAIHRLLIDSPSAAST